MQYVSFKATGHRITVELYQYVCDLLACGTYTNKEIAELTGYKTNVRGVKIRYQEERLIVDAVITVSYGNNIIDVARKAQEAVLTAVQSSTGFDAAEVNVHVTGIVF